MSKRAKKTQQTGKTTKPARRTVARQHGATGTDGLPANYWNACDHVRNGQYEKARAIYARLERSAGKTNPRLDALVQNDLAVLTAMEGELDAACHGLRGGRERWRMSAGAAESGAHRSGTGPVGALGGSTSAQDRAGAR